MVKIEEIKVSGKLENTKVVYDKIKLLDILDKEITDENFYIDNKYVTLKNEADIKHWRLVSIEQLIEKNIFKMFGPAYREFFNKAGKFIFMYNYCGKKLLSVIMRNLVEKEFMDVSINSGIVYGLNEIPEDFKYGDTILITEGLYDKEVMQLYLKEMNVKAYPIALLTSSLSNKKAELLSTITDCFIINPDNDKAGNNAIEKDIKLLKSKVIEKSGRVKIGILKTPENTPDIENIKDIGDCYPISKYVTNNLLEKIKTGIIKMYKE